MDDSIDRKRIIAAIAAAAMAFGHSACAWNDTHVDTVEQNTTSRTDDKSQRRVGDKPTERELAIARSIGKDDEYVASIESNGLDYWGAEYLGTADRMLSHLEEKYSIEFTATSIQGPEINDRVWSLRANVTHGEHAGTSVEARLPITEHGEQTDNLVPQLYEGELIDLAWHATADVLKDVDAHGVASAYVAAHQYGDDVHYPTDTRNLAVFIPTTMDVYISPWCTLSDEELSGISDVLNRRLSDEGILCSWNIKRIKATFASDLGEISVNEFSPTIANHVVEVGIQGSDWVQIARGTTTVGGE